MHTRNVTRIAAARPATDGAGVKINRLVGFDGELAMDPFLMLDEIRSDNRDDFVAGFPAHPHRGFETVTYMREGGFRHEDSLGNQGQIGRGGAQWMTAARGVIHSEMPIADADRMHGFQFWLNLPAADKMHPPAYRDIQSGEITRIDKPDASIRLIAGELAVDDQHHSGPVSGNRTETLIADIMPHTGGLRLAYGAGLSSQFYVYEGSVRVGDQTVAAGELAYLSPGATLHMTTDAPAGLLLFGGRPLGEPVVHHGPFVMNSQGEIDCAIDDYRNGRFIQH